MTLGELMAALSGKRPEPQVRTSPDGGLNLREILAGAQVQPSMKSPYERTMRPGETRSASDVQDMLAEVILAAGGAMVPGVGPKGQARQAPARIRPGYEKQFQKWFGGSAAVDPSGKPLDLYHGTRPGTDIKEFVPGKAFLTTSVERANGYAQSARAALTGSGKELDGVVNKVHVAIKKPFVVRTESDIDLMRSPEMIRKLRSEGYDGFISPPGRWDGEQIYLPFSPSQIKSATGNRGTYDPNSPRIDE